MPKQKDSLQQFISLRTALQQERAGLQKRLREIDAVLGAVSDSAEAPAATRRPGRPGRPAAAQTTRPPRRDMRGRRSQNALSLREAISKVTTQNALSVREIVNGVQKMGYRFQSTNPLNSVGAYLYGPEGKKHFKRADGKFSPK